MDGCDGWRREARSDDSEAAENQILGSKKTRRFNPGG